MNPKHNDMQRLCLQETLESAGYHVPTSGGDAGVTAGLPQVPGKLEDTLSFAFREGFRRMENGRIQEAKGLFRLVLTACPDHADSLHLLGVIAHREGQPDEAYELIRKAVEQRPLEAHYHNNLGNVLRDLGRPGEAIEHFRTAMRLRPGSPEIDSNLGNVLRDLGRLEEAADCFRSALRLRSDIPDIHYNLGNVLVDLGRLAEARACYREALQLNPNHAEACFSLGNVLMALRRPEEAEIWYRSALLARPHFPEAYNNLGNVFHELNLLKAAELCYRDALRQRPEYAEAYYNLGCSLAPQNNLIEATECFEKALALKPDYGAARLALCMANLPILYSDERKISERRAGYEACLKQLAEEGPTAYRGLADGVGASQPFFLAYQGYNDRKLQGLYGSLVCRIMAGEYPPAALASPPAPGGKIRVGIVSGFFCRHTVWKLLIEGWLKQLDRNRFEVFGYHTGTGNDAETAEAAGLCDRFVQGALSGSRWREIITVDAPHVLLYPEIGMDPQSARLAAQRLAPVQCSSWGHPVTSGFPTVDYFLTSDLMEPLDGRDHYTEKLIRLPNLGSFYIPDPPPAVELDRSELGLRPTATVYWSGQALYKYLPRFDLVFPRIAEKVRDSQFVFIEYARSRRVTDQFRLRLRDAFALLGLDAADHCVILPYLDRDRFVAAVGLCDVVLDTIGWSGGKSTLDCLAHDIPIVTLSGTFMRSRHTAAILRRLDVSDTVTDTIDGYVRTAVRLAADPQRRKQLARRMAKNKHRLYMDSEYITVLEAFLERAVRGPA